MDLKIDSLNQCCDGLQIKARGMAERLQLSEYCEAERKSEEAEKNFFIIRDSVSDSDFSGTMSIQCISRGTTCISSEAPEHPWLLTGVFGIQGGKNKAFVSCFLESRSITSSQNASELNGVLVEIRDLSKLARFLLSSAGLKQIPQPPIVHRARAELHSAPGREIGWFSKSEQL